MSEKEEGYFYNDICLFCEQKAEERYFGNHGRDSKNTCSCQARRDWEKAKQEVTLKEEIARLRLYVIKERQKLRNVSGAKTQLEHSIEAAEKTISAYLAVKEVK